MFSLSFRSLCRRSHRILIRVMAISAFLGVFGLLGTGRLFAAGGHPEVDRLVRRLREAPAEDLPFSFVFGGTSSRELLGGWRQTVSVDRLDSKTIYRSIWQDSETGLEVRVEAVAYRQFPVVDWTLYLRNGGTQPSPLLEQVLPLELNYELGTEVKAVLHHHVGSLATASDYAPQESVLDPGTERRFAPVGGRSSNGVWPYFNLALGSSGVIVGIGWPGQWSAEFSRASSGAIRLRAGQELLRARLLPGEEIRSPRVVLLFWEGDRWRGQNLWRRWMMAHNMPRPGGKLPPPMFLASSSRVYEEMIHANEENQKMHIDRYLEEGLRIDYWWMDAGWYVQEQGWPQVGTWEVDRRRFPRGLRAISDYAHARGVRILVWFEPERVMPGTWLYENHPEWLLKPFPEPHPLAGLRGWVSAELGRSEPCVTFNSAPEERRFRAITWAPGALSFHPGGKGEYAVIRFSAAESGPHQVQVTFTGLDRTPTTTEVFVVTRGQVLFQQGINLQGGQNEARWQGEVPLSQGEPLDFIVGWGNGSHICDTTGIEVRVTAPGGQVYVAAEGFAAEKNPAAPWSYGWLPAGDRPDPAQFRLLDKPTQPEEAGPRLLNLADRRAWEWLVEHVDGLIRSEGIDLYRQDFNIDPLPFWRAADAADRQGITENHYVVGFLRFWDELLRRHPDMLIDSCASGGRRNDLETLRRAVPLWRSDYAFEPIGHQCMTYGISLWLPYHGTGTVAYSAAPYYGSGLTLVEPYAFWSNATPSLGCGIDIRVRELDYEALRRLYRAWREFGQFYYADFYPLTPFTQSPRDWIGWQFHDPDTQSGAIQLFRRQECQEEQYRVRLRELEPEVSYRFRALEGWVALEATGRELMTQGLLVRAPSRPGAVVCIYQKQ